MLVKTYGSAVHGIDATTITVETDVSRGIRFNLVGLPRIPLVCNCKPHFFGKILMNVLAEY